MEHGRDPGSDFEREAQRLAEAAAGLPTAERDAFVARAAGGDRKLRARVAQLLDRLADSTAAIRRSAGLPGAHPEQIGPFRILGELGEGGMGKVYLAEQREPIRRRVALKVLKAGFDGKAFLTRFDAERQALAMMEHSCIAKVLDAGSTDDGRPYLAMEYVKGVRITDYCDTHKLGLEERIELFRQVCGGVQHAHTKGVMHRDLKPSNVLVTLQDGKPCPKIIDFGLAKAVDHRLVPGTLFTEQGQILGTPEYMSPEQAGIGGLDLDTRTDIYSLGVLLYELLTGTLPLSRDELMRHGWLEMQRLLREGETRKPSTKVTTLGASATAFAQARQLPLGELQRRLRGELDWIVMKAIEKDRTRRYETASEFATDLEHYLRHEPVRAGPPSTGYLLRKALRRHRAALLTGAAVVLALVVGLVWALVERAEAERQRGIASERAAAAETALANYRLLEDGIALRELERRARATLWPEGSGKVDPMAAWLSEVEAWLSQPRDHDRVLQSLAARATRDEAGRLQFASRQDQLLHEALSDLQAAMARFRGDRGSLTIVRKALDWSRQVVQRTLEQPAPNWREAIERVRTNATYGGLTLAPQEGLVPLGPDPTTGLEEFAFPRSGDVPTRDLFGVLPVTGTSAIVVVLLPGGTVTLGSPARDPTGRDTLRNEQPQVRVLLDPFFVGKYEVTQAQWRALSGGEAPSKYPRDFDPVEMVSWLSATEVLDRTGLVLPTEAQWEYACRAGTTTEWWFGDRTADGDRSCLLDEHGKARLNAADGYLSRAAGQNYVPEAVLWPELDDGRVFHGPVHEFAANAFGLFQVHGNVQEMTRGTPTSYDKGTFAPGDGELLGGATDTMVVRGGSFYRGVDQSRSAARAFVQKEWPFDSVGMRVVRPLQR